MKCFAEKRFFKWQEDEVAVSLRNHSGSYGGGSEVLIVQRVTGTLSQGAHPGSYNGQDAYNDMLIVGEDDGRGDRNGIRTGKCRNYEGGVSNIER